MAIDFEKSGQAPALEFINKDMLVSASAGSGKTTVMVEKIMRYLKKGDITRLIVLTFTKASAADMREKLTEKLSDAVRLGDEHAVHYKEQLRLLPFAFIGTIDSICGQIYKRYFEEIGTSPALDLLDDEEGKALRSQAMDEIFVELIKGGDDTFNELATLYGKSKNFDGLKETINLVLNFLSAQECPATFMAFAKLEAEKDFIESKAVKDLIAYYRKAFGLMRPKAEMMVKAALEVQDATDKERAANYAKATELDDICTAITYQDDLGFVEFVEKMGALSAMPKKTKTSDENLKYIEELAVLNNRVKELVTKAKENFDKGIDNLRREDDDSKRLVAKILDVVEKVRLRYQELKTEEGKQDFEDVERFALKIFENKTITKEFSESIDYIFLDEYQDTNKLQEAIFKKIARGNLFMVGDVKQAIYGFREAEPQIFLDKLNRYQTEEEGKNVPLNKNFRSAQEVLSFVDKVFSELMTYDFGGIDYKGESLFGEMGLDSDSIALEPCVEVAVFSDEQKEKAEADDFVYSVKGGRKHAKEEEIEDYYIASKIQSLVGSEKIFDKSIGSYRPLRYGDIAVLYRTKTQSKGTRKVFDKMGIPYSAEGFDGNVSTEDIDAINGYLRTIDNFKQDQHLAGAMLSPFGGFSESELSEIRKASYKLKFFHESVLAYDGALNDKIDGFFKQLSKYKKLSALVDVPTLVGAIMTDTGYITKLFSEGRTDRINYYNAFIQTLRSKKFSLSLESYLEFLDSGVDFKIEEPQGAVDAVSMMTVHKSKGLEFPVVFMAHSGTEMNKSAERQTIVIDSRYGIGVNDFDHENGQTMKPTRRKAIEKGILQKQKYEALRLMYVAFTRAKCRLYVSGKAKLEEDCLELKGSAKYALASELETFMDWVVYAAMHNPEIEVFVNPTCTLITCEQQTISKEQFTSAAPLTFAPYAYQESTALSNKYTVTALNAKNREETAFVPSLDSQNAEIGIDYHKVMELIDFNIGSESEIKDFVAKLESEGRVGLGTVDPAVIKKTLSHPLFDVVRKGECKREQEFIYYAPACEVLEGTSATDYTLVQGVMDLLVEGEENILIDYKVSGAPIEVLRGRYARQIALYARAYEEMSGKKLSRKAVFVLNRGEVVEF
ncbi:MAG: UvrD-helicase domain-containing protein [Clostridia bacterium]|nr:UvrD-helicase domain-containing protein [Clostridia bacterium]